MRETAVRWGEPSPLIGVITPGQGPAVGTRPGVVLLNSGLIHRVGPNRIYVRLARMLASLGYVCIRFDMSGVGDSPARTDRRGLEARRTAEAREAMDALERHRPGTRRFVLFGNCSGAATAFATAVVDRRVEGAILVNPQGSRPFRFYLRLLRNPRFWSRLARGTAKLPSPRQLGGLLRKRSGAKTPRALPGEPTAASPRDAVSALGTLVDRGVRMLFVFCEWDPSLDFYRAHVAPRLDELGQETGIDVEVIPGMNHELDLLWGQDRLVELVRGWARSPGAGSVAAVRLAAATPERG